MSRMPKYQNATDYIFINALSKACGIKLPQDLEEALKVAFEDYKRFIVPDYYYLQVVKTRYPCVADFCNPNFHKTELFDLMQSQPDNYFLLIDAFESGADSIYFAFNNDYFSQVQNKLKNPNKLIITKYINGDIKQLIPASTLLL